MVTIAKTENEIAVTCPYDSDFPWQAKKLGGKWNGTQWIFDPRDEQHVRELCFDLFGSDGLSSQPTVTLRLAYEEGRYARRQITAAGRTIFRVNGKGGRSATVSYGEGAVYISGASPKAGPNSPKEWEINIAEEGVVVLLRDVPKNIAENLLKNGVRKGEFEPVSIEIEAETPRIDRAALIAERERLTALLAEIDALLAQPA